MSYRYDDAQRRFFVNRLLQHRRKSPRIDIVPLVDVLMVLIVFFLVTMQFRNLRALNLRLPKIETAGSNLLRNEIILSVDRDGRYFLNDAEVDEPTLIRALASAASLAETPTALIVADEEVPLKRVTRLVDLCRSNGLRDFRLQSR